MPILVLLFGCKVEDEYYSYFNAENISEKEILISELQLEAVVLDSVESSHVGLISIEQDSIFFIDQVLCEVFSFDINGTFHSKHLGKGRGPGEYSGGKIQAYCKLPGGSRFFLDGTLNKNIFDENWQRIEQFRTSWRRDHLDPVNPDPTDPYLYSHEWEKLIIRPFSENEILIPIYSEHKNFNVFIDGYYQEGRIFYVFDIKNQDFVNLLGRRSPEYLNYKYIPHHSFFSYDIDSEGNFYISHEIDSLIYVYDSDFNPLYTFGISGSDMDTDYQEVPRRDIKKMRELYFEDRPLRGWYNEVEYFEETEILFRSYKKSGDSPYDGLQIYHKNVLIGDIDVPEDFVVKGYIEPYYYSSADIDVEKGEIKIYRFKLPDLND